MFINKVVDCLLLTGFQLRSSVFNFIQLLSFIRNASYSLRMGEKLRNILSLSDGQMTNLKRARVNSIGNFLSMPPYRLHEVLEVEFATVKIMKDQLERERTMDLVTGSKFLDNWGNRETYITGIKQLDELFGTGGIVSGAIIEVFGLPESGKTMLLNTIMVNTLQSSHDEDERILFIDTKRDFQAMRLKKMMDDRGIPETKQHSILKSISVEDVSTLEELIETLQNISSNRAMFERLKIIMIDSIAVPFYLYIGNPCYSLGRMTEVVQIMKNLSLQNYTVSSN